MFKESTKRLAVWYLVGCLVLAAPTFIVTGDAFVAAHIGMWLGGLPGGFLATNYTYGLWPFQKKHPVEGSYTRRGQ